MNKYIISTDKINEEFNGQLIYDKDKKYFCWTTKKCYSNIIVNCIGFIFEEKKDSHSFLTILNKAKSNLKIKNHIKIILLIKMKIIDKKIEYNNYRKK